MADARTDSDDIERRVCVTCAAMFDIEPRERAWFVERGMMLPRRCRPCRAQRRATQAAAGAAAERRAKL